MQFSKWIFITLTSVACYSVTWAPLFVSAKASPNQSLREYPIEVHEMVKARIAAQRRAASVSHQGTWGAWSSWSPCSRSCGGGVATQSRECEPLQPPAFPQAVTEKTKRRRRVPLVDRTPLELDNVTSFPSTSRRSKSQCVGLYKRFHLCNSQPCPAGSKDFRQSQCEAFNGKLFMGRNYMWEPFLDAPNPCVLNCRAVGFRFYATLNQTVVDGTPCRAATPHHGHHYDNTLPQHQEPWICVAGQCKHVGCDGVVGSDKRWDACGECGGTNSSCRLFSGLFSNHASLQAGYNLVTTLPRGACNISVSEMTPSRNYLALRRPSGNFLLNGDWQINWAGEYEAGGVTFVYRPQDTARGEALSARGPLLEPVDLMVLYEQSNLAIKYEYTLPISAGIPPMNAAGPPVAPPVIRSPHGVMVQPPQPPHHHQSHHHTGHHHQHHESHPPPPPLLGFSPATNPEDVTVRDGPFHDTTENRRHHNVASMYPFSGAGGGTVGDEAQPPTAALRPRNRKVRKFVWRHASFSECSKSCGGGMQTASAVCVRDYNQAPVPDKRCVGQERIPPQTVRCNNKPCPAEWDAGDWGSCSATCGAGLQTRSVVCRQHISASLTMKVAEGACLGPVMERTRRCQLKPCSSSGARWAMGDWGPCAAPCGKGARSRIVRCVAPDGSDLNTESCNVDDRPEDQESCDAGPCTAAPSALGAQWLVSEWAQRCSEECGTGVQTRRVICSTGSCDAAARPEASRACSSDKQCSGKWFAGPWGQCSSSCGQGRQSRDVVCVAFVRGQFRVALDMNCPTSLKPPVERACSERPCGPEWFMADWGTCSHSCGTGSQKRDIRCLDESQRSSSTCSHELRPAVRRVCNTHSCEPGHQDMGSSLEDDQQNAVAPPRERLHARPSHHVSTSLGSHVQAHDAHDENGAGDQAPQEEEEPPKGPDCVDKFPNCQLVVQARLCRYKYYRNACCVACHRKSG